MTAISDLISGKVSLDTAIERVIVFAQQFGEAHLTLACHAAFPLVLTPELLYQIWANFVPQAPWIAVSDVLLSRLCREVGYELYEMDVVVRNVLLKELKEDERFGHSRLTSLSDFLIEYVAQQLDSHDPDVRNLAQAQQWAALAYTRPSAVVRELALALAQLVQEKNTTELFRVAALVEVFAEPLAEFEPLLVYSRAMMSFARADERSTIIQLAKVIQHGRQPQVSGIQLPIPEELSRNIAKLAEGDAAYQRQQTPSSGKVSEIMTPV